MVDINSIKARNKLVYSDKQAFFPMDFSFIHKSQTKLFQCAYCGAFIPEKLLSRDHVYPKSKGGNSTTASCTDCNTIKKDMLPIEWAVYAANMNYDIAPTLYKGVGNRETFTASFARTARKIMAKEINAVPP